MTAILHTYIKLASFNEPTVCIVLFLFPGIFKPFFELTFYVPLGRLSYSVYLVGLGIQCYHIFNQRKMLPRFSRVEIVSNHNLSQNASTQHQQHTQRNSLSDFFSKSFSIEKLKRFFRGMFTVTRNFVDRQHPLFQISLW